MDAGRFEDVFEKIACGKLAQAQHLLQPLVQSTIPDPDAMFILGRVRLQGRNTVTAGEDAFKWFKKAARLGHLYGKFYAAVAYFNGIGVRKNRKTGMRWLQDCADRGCAGAMHELASLYLESDGLDYDTEKAIEHLTDAANRSGIPYRGEPRNFARCTSLEEFVNSNEAEAIAKAQEYLAYIYSGKEEDVPRNASIAAKWAAKAVANGFDEFIWPLIGLHQELGNQSETKMLLLELVQKQDPRAMYELARIYEKSGSKEEQDKVYRLDAEARKGGYVHSGDALPTPFPKPERQFVSSYYFDDEDEWPALLKEARGSRIDDPYELKIKVRIYYALSKNGCEEGRSELKELIDKIGVSKYREVRGQFMH